MTESEKLKIDRLLAGMSESGGAPVIREWIEGYNRDMGKDLEPQSLLPANAKFMWQVFEEWVNSNKRGLVKAVCPAL
jgi:hypothetical protein